MPRKKSKFGDVFEIATPAGLAYVQFTHLNDVMGHLVRVLPGLFATRPEDIGELAKQKELYFVFYPLDYAWRDNKVSFVSNQPIPEWAQPYPLMRWMGFEDENGKRPWKILRASDSLTLEFHQRTPLIWRLTPEQKKLSIHCLRGHEAMLMELARGWTPERAEEFWRQADLELAAKADSGQLNDVIETHLMDHYLYFPRKSKAVSAAKELRARGFSVEISRGVDHESWLALTKGLRPEDGDEMEQLRDDLEALAAKFDGDYDGWEMAVAPRDSNTAKGSNLIQ